MRRDWLINLRSEAITLNSIISFSNRTYRDDFSVAESLALLSLLAHEITHVWQYQNCIRSYWWMKAGLEHLQFGKHTYEYELDESKRLDEYRFEQQAQIVQDYVIARETGARLLPVFETIIYRSISRDGDKGGRREP